MTEPDDFQCLMVGLPRTGKTTFLAALWHVVRSDEVPDSLRLDRLEGDQEYLNLIADQWSQCKELDRTSGGEIKVDIRLRDPSTGHLVRLRIPDMSGELYESLWQTRTCLISFLDLVNAVDGCLLFVHPAKIRETAWIDEANATYSQWQQENQEEPKVETPGSDAETTGTDWEPRFAPTQVQMVEILQFLTQNSVKQFRIVVVISAWDLVKELVSPEQWLKKQLPLLWQFLTANTDRFTVTYMGVSAQGGEVTGQNSETETLLDHNMASRRIRICASNEEGNDISLPIRWLMSN
ncbi:MAG: hypothetical protein JWM11_1214 [Planctomycetaceae bacterium]|nr:hypothetical protein [Planctomycetaceae bacterium]